MLKVLMELKVSVRAKQVLIFVNVHKNMLQALVNFR